MSATWVWPMTSVALRALRDAEPTEPVPQRTEQGVRNSIEFTRPVLAIAVLKPDFA
jgi:hypothetical protein